MRREPGRSGPGRGLWVNMVIRRAAPCAMKLNPLAHIGKFFDVLKLNPLARIGKKHTRPSFLSFVRHGPVLPPFRRPRPSLNGRTEMRFICSDVPLRPAASTSTDSAPPRLPIRCRPAIWPCRGPQRRPPMHGGPGRPRGNWVGSSQPQTVDEAAHVSPDSLLPEPLASASSRSSPSFHQASRT